MSTIYTQTFIHSFITPSKQQDEKKKIRNLQGLHFI